MEFLIDPCEVVLVVNGVVGGEHIVTVVVVDVVFTAEEVRNLGLVVAHIVAEVKTAG